MNEGIILLLLQIFIIFVLSKSIARLMKTGNKKYRIPIFYGRALLGFLLAMFLYTAFLLLRGEDILSNILG